MPKHCHFIIDYEVYILGALANMISLHDWDFKGDVLEVSAGTGRNIDYYPVKKCSSVTMVDTSASMLNEARKKFHSKFVFYL